MLIGVLEDWAHHGVPVEINGLLSFKSRIPLDQASGLGGKFLALLRYEYLRRTLSCMAKANQPLVGEALQKLFVDGFVISIEGMVL